MPVTKNTVNDIQTGQPVSPSVANAPHEQLELNIDNIIPVVNANEANIASNTQKVDNIRRVHNGTSELEIPVINGDVEVSAPKINVNGNEVLHTGNFTTINNQPILELIYPVGSIYMNANVDTNPATFFGFGQWEAISGGRVLLGKNDGSTLDQEGYDGGAFNIGDESGEFVHTLSLSEMPSHNHGVNDSGHSHAGSTVQKTGFNTYGSADNSVNEIDNVNLLGIGGAFTNISIRFNGGNVAHNNIQPYLVVSIWKRIS